VRPLLIIKPGRTYPQIAARRGDYEEWIAARMGLPAARVQVVNVFEDEPLPDPAEVGAAVVTGSSAMVSERLAWSERTGAWLVGAVEAGTPLLGICYGHQLLAQSLGGRVGVNPRGREIGTIHVELGGAARDDALLQVLPETLVVQATHVESVLELPPGTHSLAASAGDPHHAYAAGPRAWGVQFHPEFDADVITSYLRERREIIAHEGLDPDALIEGARDTDHGAQLLRRFAELAFS